MIGDLSGAELTGGATLTIPLSEPLADSAGIGYWNPQTEEWEPIPSTIDTNAKAISAQITHLSLYQPWTWDLNALSTTLKQKFAALADVTASIRAVPPVCSPDAPAGVTYQVTGGRSDDPSLHACVQDAGNGQIILRIVNNRPYAMIITPPDGATLTSLSRDGLLAAAYQNKSFLLAVVGDYLPAGGQADYTLSSTGPSVSATGNFSWRTYTIDSLLSLILLLLGAKTDKEALEKMTPDRWATVVQCVGDFIYSDPPNDAVSAVVANLGCISLVDDVVLAPISAVRSVVVTVAGAYDEGQDSAVGSPGVVTVTRKSAVPDTQIAQVYPLDDSYQPLPGYTVDDTQTIHQTSCGSTSTNPSQFGGSAQAPCADVTGGRLDPCWPESTNSMLCLFNPTDKTLVRLKTTNTVTNFPDAGTRSSGGATIRPWHIILQDDSSCYARTQGAYGLPGIGYVCGETSEWGAIGAINESSGVWTAPIIRPDAAAAWLNSTTDRSDVNSVPTQPEPIKIAYFPGAGSGANPIPSPATAGSSNSSESCPDGSALLNDLTVHNSGSIQSIARVTCDSGFAVALGQTHAYGLNLLFQETDSGWIEVDIGKACASGVVPSALDHQACHTG